MTSVYISMQQYCFWMCIMNVRTNTTTHDCFHTDFHDKAQSRGVLTSRERHLIDLKFKTYF